MIGAVFALTIILLDFYLLRKRKIQGRGFVFWFLVGAFLGLFSIVPSFLSAISFIFGTEFAISSILATGFLFFLLAIFYLHYKITELQGLLMKLTMEVSLIRYGQKQAERGTANPKSGNSTKRKDKNERKTSRSRRKTSV
ncbi:MAG: DUF2304 domain-containing protein [Candidatus Bathyarchaeia archaeon]